MNKTNIFLSWLKSKNLLGWYCITLEQIFGNKKTNFVDIEYLTKLNPFEENPFSLQCENNSWLLLSDECQPKPVFSIDWVTVSYEWERDKKELIANIETE